MTQPLYDIAIIGGGVNGAGIARDAAGRGLSVLLCEKGDLAEGTSSRSSKLVHGGLRYLEYYDFRLVREALIEREVLLNAAPHIIWPLRFVLPHSPEQRPAWVVRTGLFLYDHLGGRKKLPGTRTLDLATAPEGRSIKPPFRRAFEYSDCWVDDARLVVTNALDARTRGADIRTRTAVTQARREAGAWTLHLQPEGAPPTEARARILVNAAGPWVDDVLGRVAGQNTDAHVRLIKGSHIIVRKFWNGPNAFLLQNDDTRIVFVIPYQGSLGLIGTTDIPCEGDPAKVAITPEETDYLLKVVNRYMKPGLTRADVVADYAGVRPLYDDRSGNPSAVTRDYRFDIEDEAGKLPLLSVFGGKITTYRRLSEHALEKLAPYLPKPGKPWTAGVPMPGGDMPGADFEAYETAFAARRPWLPPDLARHYARLYGTRAEQLLAGAKSLADLGTHFGGLFYQREAAFVMREEWARTTDDILMRRTKHGLFLTPAEHAGFSAWMETARLSQPQPGTAAAPA